MIIYQPSGDSNEQEFMRKVIRGILMNQAVEQHKEKYNLQKWEYGEPIDMLVTELYVYVLYSEGTLFKYGNISDGADRMTVTRVEG